MAEQKKGPTAQQRRAAIVKAYKHIFNLPEGKVVLQDLMKRGHMMAPTHDKNCARSTDKNEGKRELVLYILTNMNVNNELLAEMIKDTVTEDRKHGL